MALSSPETVCPSRTAYRYGCRCRPCKAENAAYVREWRYRRYWQEREA